MSLRATCGSAFRATYSSGATHKLGADHPYTPGGVHASELAESPRNPYRKRPVKLIYDRNEFHMFRLPSEKSFLLGTYDYNDLFGERNGINHSPHIRS